MSAVPFGGIATAPRAGGATRVVAFAALVVAYEWLVSGLAKALEGGFLGGLAGELRDDAKADGGSYGHVLRSVFIPHAHLVGVLVVVGEIATGVALVGAAAGLVLGGGRTARVVLGVGALVGAFMTLNFQLAAGEPLVRIVAPSVFDEGVPLDALLTLLQIGFAVYGLAALRSRRTVRSPRGGAAPPR